MTILLGADHAGFALRRILASHLIAQGYAVSEMGATSESAYDYPDVAQELSKRIQRSDGAFGVLICGTGIGMAMTANKFVGIRAAVCWNEESARLSREHNHANILCLGARLISPDLAIKILDTFLSTSPSEEPRHVRRVEKINMIDICSTSVDRART